MGSFAQTLRQCRQKEVSKKRRKSFSVRYSFDYHTPLYSSLLSFDGEYAPALFLTQKREGQGDAEELQPAIKKSVNQYGGSENRCCEAMLLSSRSHQKHQFSVERYLVIRRRSFTKEWFWAEYCFLWL